MISETDKAWLAGFIDGEGYVGLHGAQGERKNYWSAHIGLRHTHLLSLQHVIDLLREADVIGYQIVVDKRSSNNRNHKDSYLFNVAALPEILKFGELVRPYAITKAYQSAEAAVLERDPMMDSRKYNPFQTPILGL